LTSLTSILAPPRRLSTKSFCAASRLSRKQLVRIAGLASSERQGHRLAPAGLLEHVPGAVAGIDRDRDIAGVEQRERGSRDRCRDLLGGGVEVAQIAAAQLPSSSWVYRLTRSRKPLVGLAGLAAGLERDRSACARFLMRSTRGADLLGLDVLGELAS